MRSRSTVAPFGALLAVLALVLGGLVGGPTPAGAQSNPYARGPNPGPTTLNGNGPFALRTEVVPAGNGFAGGTIYYPTDTSQGTFGAVVVSPGFISPQAAIAWTGPRIASHGFVVFTIDINTGFDLPGQRATQMQAALDYLTQQSSVRSRIDAGRLGAMGHSMGGGGTLELSRSNPDLQAAVPLQPWDLFQNFSGIRVPTLIVGAQNDLIAGVGSHSEPFYEQIPASTEKAYLEVAGQSHFLGNTAQLDQARSATAWLKRYIDNDTRYDQFLCPGPSGLSVAEYRDTCPP